MPSLPDAVQADDIATSRLRTHVLRSGGGSATALVLIHGNVSSARFFAETMAALGERRPCLAPCGASAGPSGAQHKALEEVVIASGLDWTFLRCGGFAANTLAWAPMIKAEGVVRAPYLNAATAPIAEEDVAAAAVRVLLGDGHADARYVLTGPGSITQAEQARAIGAAIGRTLRTEELPPEVFRQAASAHLPAAAVDDLLRYWAEYVGRPAEMSPDLEKVAGRPAMTFAEWATRHAASFR